MKPRTPPEAPTADEDRGPPPRPSSAIQLEKYAVTLYRFLLRRLRLSHDAEDLVQTTFLRFWQSPQHELVRKPEAYLYQIASNVLVEHRLRQRRDLLIFDSDMIAEQAELQGDSENWRDAVGEAQALTQQLQRVLGQIPPMYRAALVLRACEGLSFEEIGTRLSLSPKTAKTYVARAIAACRLADWDR